MLKRILRVATIAFAAVASLALFAPAAHAQTEQQKLIADAEKVLSNFLRDPDMTWLQRNIGTDQRGVCLARRHRAGQTAHDDGG